MDNTTIDNTTKLGTKYYDDLGREHLVTVFDFTLPDNCTFTQPPHDKEGFGVKLINNEWQYVPDYRGKIAYQKDSKVQQEITELGDLDSALTLLPPPSQYHHWDNNAWILSADNALKLKSEQQQTVWELIKNERYRRTHSGVYLKTIDKWFHTDEPSRIQYLTIHQLPALPANLQWKTMNNSFVTMTPSLLNELIVAMVLHEQADFANAEKHRVAMLSADNPQDYDFSTGWSEIYE
ncbi:protein of unknown function [Pasteurella testudinis DSM 23072]|uniref:DUF4376 domain-containing protein n=1 Tax=Pasteurella testudinis DSM 23072 TaxID=1122938 RepID=A0A1W1UNL1_9PAST|nr:DUF4376 domain-containing protein [Pasteurella testudinis]SMB82391.1 protein of unknown function [Pasteurella testudinis DSM 23072]SUB52222.1 Uncharacterised protein [Pasteurella testudinis]